MQEHNTTAFSQKLCNDVLRFSDGIALSVFAIDGPVHGPITQSPADQMSHECGFAVRWAKKTGGRMLLPKRRQSLEHIASAF